MEEWWQKAIELSEELSRAKKKGREELKKEWKNKGINDRKIKDLFDLWMIYDMNLEHASELINVLVDLGKDSHDDLKDIVYELIKRKYEVIHIATECPTLLTTFEVDPEMFIIDRVYEKMREELPFGTKIGRVDVVSLFSRKKLGWLICAIEVSVSSDLKKEVEKLENVPANVKIIVVPKGEKGKIGTIDIVPIRSFDEYLENLLKTYECYEWEYYIKKLNY